MNTVWKKRFEELVMNINNVIEDASVISSKVESKHFFTGSKEVFVSNDCDLADSEKYALDHWGEGKYKKFKLVE